MSKRKKIENDHEKLMSMVGQLPEVLETTVYRHKHEMCFASVLNDILNYQENGFALRMFTLEEKQHCLWITGGKLWNYRWPNYDRLRYEYIGRARVYYDRYKDKNSNWVNPN